MYSILVRVPELGLQLLLFLTDPSQFTRAWINSLKTRPSAGEVVIWSVGIVTFLHGLYVIVSRRLSQRIGERADPRLAFPPAGQEEDYGESPMEDPDNAAAESDEIMPPASSTEQSKPRLLLISVRQPVMQQAEYGTWIVVDRLPQFILQPWPKFYFVQSGSKGEDQPQLLMFTAGIFYVVVDNVVPDYLATRKAQILILILSALVAVICLHPMAALVGTTRPLAETIDFSFVVVSFSLAYSSIIGYLTSIFLMLFMPNMLLAMINFDRSCFSSCLGTFVVIVISACATLALTRALLLALQTFYAFSLGQLCLAIVGGLTLSSVVTPILSIPSVLLFLKFRQLIEL